MSERRANETMSDYFARLERENPTTWRQKLDTLYQLIDDPVDFVEKTITQPSSSSKLDAQRALVREEVLRVLFFGYMAWRLTR